MFKFKFKPFQDNRGSFINLSQQIQTHEIEFKEIKQTNISFNYNKFTFRGIHGNRLYLENKIIHVIDGAISGALINLNPHSDKYLEVYRFFLTDKCNKILFVPSDYFNAYVTLKTCTKILYMHDCSYIPSNNLEWNGVDLIKLLMKKYNFDKYTISKKDEISLYNKLINFESQINDLSDW